MINFKNLMAISISTLVIGATSIVFASEFKTPAEIISSLTDKTQESIVAERYTGKTYGTIAKENGKLDEFKNQTLIQQKELLDQEVKNGTLTQEKANQIYSNIKERQSICDGTSKGTGIGQGRCQKNGIGLGRMNFRSANHIGVECGLAN